MRKVDDEKKSAARTPTDWNAARSCQQKLGIILILYVSESIEKRALPMVVDDKNCFKIVKHENKNNNIFTYVTTQQVEIQRDEN